MDDRFESLPNGPLTREEFDSLSLSYYDASRSIAQRVAESRGVNPGDAMRVRIGEMLTDQESGDPVPQQAE